MTTIEPTIPATHADRDVATRPDTAAVMRRYLVITAVATPANLAIYLSLLLVAGVSAFLANIAAATAVTLPAYFVTRTWVWRLGPGNARTAEVGQYWASTMFSLTLSTTTLWLLARSGAPSVVLAAAPLAVYAALWAARFCFLDRYLFRRSTV